MDKDTAILCQNVNKDYPIYKNDSQRLKGLLLPSFRPGVFTALRDINFTVNKGEIWGMIGLNGSGKSTLARIISGITYPTNGNVQTDGEVSMLSVNAGIDNYLTGRENIYFKCTLLGFPVKYIKEIEEDIIQFADIGICIDQAVRTYSSGMRSRLGFAISVYLDPDILIIDEALSVGDNSFADKSLAKMYEFKDKGKTILFVSHSVGQMQDFCDKVLWLNQGVIIGLDKPEKIIRPYCIFAREFNAMTKDEREKFVPSLEYYQEKC